MLSSLLIAQIVYNLYWIINNGGTHRTDVKRREQLNYYLKRGDTRMCIMISGEWPLVYQADLIHFMDGDK